MITSMRNVFRMVVKVLSNFAPNILSDDKLKVLIKEQKESGLYDPPQEDEDNNTGESGIGENGNDSESPKEDITTEESAETPVEQEGGDV